MLEPNFEEADGLGINQIPMIVSVKKNVIFTHRLKNSNYILELIVEPLGTI